MLFRIARHNDAVATRPPATESRAPVLKLRQSPCLSLAIAWGELKLLAQRLPPQPSPCLLRAVRYYVRMDKRETGWRRTLCRIIFRADTPAGKLFDVLLIVSILVSVTAVMLQSVESFNERHRGLLIAIEVIFTAVYTVEYILRVLCHPKPWRYVTSFFGIVDLLGVLPTFISPIAELASGQRMLKALHAIRILRVLRIFLVLQMTRYVDEATYLVRALRSSARKIAVFLLTVFTLVVILGSVMYIIEGGKNGFTNIPESIYWAIVTLTTVGYGDISPQTALGRACASLIMILGYSIIAVPTGIVTVQFSREKTGEGEAGRTCAACSAMAHAEDAAYCRKCGAELGAETSRGDSVEPAS